MIENEIIESLRIWLNKAFAYGCQLTANPIVTPEPTKSNDEVMMDVLSPYDQMPALAKLRIELLDDFAVNHLLCGEQKDTKRETISRLLDNMMEMINPTIKINSPSANHNRETMLKLTAKMMAKSSLFDIIGVQPMKGPVDQVYLLRVKHPKPKIEFPKDVLDIEKKIQKLIDSLSKKLAENQITDLKLPGFSLPNGETKAHIEVKKEVVEAKVRKLTSKWTCDDSIEPEHHSEIINAIAAESISSIDEVVINRMHEIAGEPTSTFDMKEDMVDTPTFVGDVHAALAILINKQANLIAQRTRRGAGNWCVVSPTAITILLSATTSAFTRNTDYDSENLSKEFGLTYLKYMGTLNNHMKVYCNQYADCKTPVLVGYKGNEIDAPLIYAPYVPISSSGLIIDPNTFEPVQSFMTRYGLVELEPNENYGGNGAADYLGKVGINADTLTFV